MACLSAGDMAPDFALPTDRGEEWRLSEHLGKPFILMFHRHLQWLPCQEHLSQLRQSAELAEMGVGIVALFFSQVRRLPEYRVHFDIPDSIPLLADEGRTVYKAYGMRIGSLREIYSPEVLKKYLDLIRAGRKMRLKNDEDTRQLGGDVIVGPDGRIILAHCSKNQADRPTPETLAAALRGA